MIIVYLGKPASEDYAKDRADRKIYTINYSYYDTN